ncbi:hypothetical protein N7532_005038 [Penicillium argentinense]|uniref:PHD and RING finger domain protein n=1 Tax=Penicillium argentinense TaxID=1131581 RepID=A0A9W9FD79_9EURO|nr:uncharacterized protein N7532_005038 [Penicillium argentinense]KAJ5098037.1 hypothetical protein N7532_005038 [Penicillium argentinense]
MSETCIVCLGDLGESASDPLEPVPSSDQPSKHTGTKDKRGLVEDHSTEIAQLLPCEHVLHHNCLKPWIERANSCPICRRSFHQINLSDRLGDPVSSSYAVEDRVQQADVDPSMITEDIEDDLNAESQPCLVCGEADHEDVLLLCHECDVPTHTYCIGLDEVPSDDWYCAQCEPQRALAGTFEELTSPRSLWPGRRRTRTEQRRLQDRSQVHDREWARVWQSIRNRLQLDLDFPFDDEQNSPRARQERRRAEANRREFRQWQRRFEIADRQGGGRQLQDAATLLSLEPRPSRPRVPREPTPDPESLEEMRAWNAFERAREIEDNPNAARKRKEPTLSPSPEPTEPQRQRKRPRTRRPEELAAMAQRNGESSSRAATSRPRLNGDGSGEVSFLSTLLKEVEDSSTADHNTRHVPPAAAPVVADLGLPASGPSSPSISPASSTYSSPRLATTPPPVLRSRPISPLQLSSPSECSSPPYSPEVSYSDSPNSPTMKNGSPRSRIPQAARSSSRNNSRPRPSFVAAKSENQSRSRDTPRPNPNPSPAVKTDIKKMVRTSLDPYYAAKTISKDQYKEINWKVSFKLYERAGATISFDDESRADFVATAKAEVQKAIRLLRTQKKDKQPMTHASSDSDGSVM